MGGGFLLIGVGLPVVVLIDGVGRAAVDMIAVVGHDRRDELEVGILRPDRVEELGEAVVVGIRLVEEILVANLDPMERERRGMAVGDAAGPTSCRGRR